MLSLNDRHRAEHDGTAAAYTLLHSFAEVFADPLAAALAQGDGHAFDALLLGVIGAAAGLNASAPPSR